MLDILFTNYRFSHPKRFFLLYPLSPITVIHTAARKSLQTLNHTPSTLSKSFPVSGRKKKKHQIPKMLYNPKMPHRMYHLPPSHTHTHTHFPELLLTTDSLAHSFLTILGSGLATKSCLTLVTPWTVCSLPGSTVHGILQARIPEWVIIYFSRGSSQPKNRTWVSCIAGRFFTDRAITTLIPSLFFDMSRTFPLRASYFFSWECFFTWKALWLILTFFTSLLKKSPI